MKLWQSLVAGLTAVATCASMPAAAELRINEILINAPGGTDDGQEFAEIWGRPSESVAGVSFIRLDNEGTDIGIVANVTDLTPAGAVGSNGLLLVRDSIAVLSPAPDGATTLLVSDFAPDMSNDHHAYLLVAGFTGAQLDDLDADNNGVLEVTPWTAILDVVAIINDTTEPDIATGLGGTLVSGAGVFTPDAIIRNPNDPDEVIGFDVNGANPGPYTLDGVETTNPAFAGQVLTPGGTNPSFDVDKDLAFNEVFLNVPGADNGFEFIELLGNDAESVIGVSLLIVDNDAPAIGSILNAVSLTSAFAAGGNGLLLVRDAATVLSPAPAAVSTVVVSNFTPDIPDGSTTFLLVTGFSGSVGNDLDTNDDGTLETTPWTTMLDALFVADPDGEPSIAAGLGGVNTALQTFAPDAYFLTPVGNVQVTADISGTNPGPYILSISNVDPAEYGNENLTPGSPNPVVIVGAPGIRVPFFTKRN